MKKRLLKEIEDGVMADIKMAIEESTDAERGESAMTDVSPPPVILTQAAKAATAVIMAWYRSMLLLQDLAAEEEA